jgi:hypothetical protein
MQDTLYLSSISQIFWRSSSNNSSSGKKDLVSVFSVSSSLNDNIGMVFEEGDYLLRCGNVRYENTRRVACNLLLQRWDGSSVS